MSTDTPGAGLFQAKSLTVSLTVKDIHKSLSWYTEVFGFGVERKTERDGKLRSVVLKAGDVSVSINQDDGAKGWDRVKGQGFSLRLTTDQTVDDIAQRIKKHGHKLDMEPTDMAWGVRLFRVIDPDGFKWSISKPLPPA